MQKFVSILACILCQLSVAYAQKCLAIFGVTEEVIEKPIEDARFTLYFNDSIQVPYTVISIDKLIVLINLEVYPSILRLILTPTINSMLIVDLVWPCEPGL